MTCNKSISHLNLSRFDQLTKYFFQVCIKRMTWTGIFVWKQKVVTTRGRSGLEAPIVYSNEEVVPLVWQLTYILNIGSFINNICSSESRIQVLCMCTSKFGGIRKKGEMDTEGVIMKEWNTDLHMHRKEDFFVPKW